MEITNEFKNKLNGLSTKELQENISREIYAGKKKCQAQLILEQRKQEEEQENKNKLIKLAEEANLIAKDANSISLEANRKSDEANSIANNAIKKSNTTNVIAIIALILSTIDIAIKTFK